MPSSFRTTEISDPAYESDHLRFITVKTPNLRGRGDICVFVPPGQDAQDLPVAILLHGVYGSAWCWSQKAGAHRTALRLIESGAIPPMILAMPSDGLWGDGSGYLAHESRDFERWIVDDVPDAIAELIPQASAHSPLFISGLSMGGFGALRLGAKFPERFKGISAHSSITRLERFAAFVEEPLAVLARAVDPKNESAWNAIQANAEKLPPLRFDCGVDDNLLAANRELHQQMLAAGIPHAYQEFPGTHEWPYWTKHLEATLRFFAAQL